MCMCMHIYIIYTHTYTWALELSAVGLLWQSHGHLHQRIFTSLECPSRPLRRATLLQDQMGRRIETLLTPPLAKLWGMCLEELPSLSVFLNSQNQGQGSCLGDLAQSWRKATTSAKDGLSWMFTPLHSVSLPLGSFPRLPSEVVVCLICSQGPRVEERKEGRKIHSASAPIRSQGQTLVAQ